MKKFLFGIGILLVLFILACIAAPFLFKDKIIQAANNAANQKLNATLSLGQVDVSFLQNIKRFPDITLVLSNPNVVGKNQFEGDTLIHIDKLLLAIDIKSIFTSGATMQINAIEIEGANINAIVDTSGQANWNIVQKDKTSKESKPFSLNISAIQLENININYQDYFANKTAKIVHLNHRGSGDFSTNNTSYLSSTDIESMDYYNGFVPYLKSVHLSNTSEIAIEKLTNKYRFTNNKIQLNELGLILNGDIQMLENEEMNLNLQFATENNDFKNILSLIPAIYQNNFKSIKASGKFDLKGQVNGLLRDQTYPKMDIHLDVKNGEFQYPNLPKKVTNIQVKSHLLSPGGSLDNLAINISTFSMLLGKDLFEGRLKLTQPMTDPYFELYSKGDLNLADVKHFYPLEDVQRLEGTMNIALDLKARKSDLQAKNYNKIQASGTTSIQSLIYESKKVGKPVRISNMKLEFSPQFVNLTNCNGVIGKTDFDMKGRLENFIAYYLSKDAMMTGRLDFVSNSVDLNEFVQNEEKKDAEYVYVRQKIAFDGTAKINEIRYGKMTLKNMSGQMSIKEEKILLNNVYAEMLGGIAKVSAIYNSAGHTKPSASVRCEARTFDITAVFNQMESAQKLAPILQYTTGTLSSNSDLSMTLLPDMGPDLSTLNGDFNMSIPFAKIVNLPTLNQIASITKLSQLQHLEVMNIKTKLTFVNGKMVVQPFQFKTNNLTIGMQGSQGLDKSMDYKMSVDVPFSKLGNAQSIVNGLISKFKLPFIGNINPETIRLHINIKGNFEKPEISLGAPEILSDGKPLDAKTVAVDAIKKIGEDYKSQALKTADSMKQVYQKQADDKINDIKKRAEEEINKKKNEAVDEIKKRIKIPW